MFFTLEADVEKKKLLDIQNKKLLKTCDSLSIFCQVLITH